MERRGHEADAAADESMHASQEVQFMDGFKVSV